MNRLRRLPFRHQLMLVTMLASTTALVLASSALLYYEAARSQREEERDLRSLVRVVAANSTAVLAFADERGANENLASLSRKPQVVLAVLYRSTGPSLAVYRRPGAESVPTPPRPGPDGVRFGQGFAEAVEPVVLDGERVGSVFLRADVEHLAVRIGDYAFLVAGVMAASALAALVVASKLQNSVAGPVLRLADGARAVAETRDYSLRFAEEGPEELRVLTGMFNSMLGRIQEQDAELRAARDGLEERVRERVSDLQREVQDRERAQAALRVSEERYRSIVETTSDWILAVDSHGRPLYSNPAVERILGYTTRDLMHLDLASLLHPDDRPRALETFRRSLRDGTGWAHLALRLRHRDNSYRDIECAAMPMLDSAGRFAGLQGSGHDTTERRLLEEQLRQAQKMEAVGRLAGGVAHDFNNLLGVILGYSELLLKREPEGAAGMKLEQIHRAAERGAGLTRQLLAFSRKQILDLRVVDLGAILTETASMLQRVLGEDVELVITNAAGLGLVRADTGQMEQILMNLAVNSRDAMPTGGRLTLQTANVAVDAATAADHRGMVPGSFVMLTVSDTGVGMSPEVLSHLFEPFFTTKEKGRGTGLGLAMVYGIVKQSGGYVFAESTLGSGTTFVIYLPRVDQGAAQPPQPLPRKPAAGGSETVLLVEDEAALRTLAREILETRGYRVLEAESGLAALELARSCAEPIHALLTDVVMPGISGPELAERLRLAIPGLVVLYMSGYTDDALGRHGALAPGTRLIQKPFTAEGLTRSLREALSGSTD